MHHWLSTASTSAQLLFACKNMEEQMLFIDESGDDKMLWETIGKPAYEKGLQDGRNESPLFAVIPVSILENKNLSANAKLLYGEICALSKKSGKCYATNDYLGSVLGLKERSIPNLLKELSGNGLVFIDIERSKRGTYRNITVSFFNEGGHHSITRGGLAKERGLKRNRQIEIDNKIAAEAAKPFSFKEYLAEMKQGQRHIRVIALYWEHKDTEYENVKQAREAIGRDLRAAKKLAGYSDERILDTMDHLDGIKYLDRWTLETVHKYIDEKVGKKKNLMYA